MSGRLAWMLSLVFAAVVSFVGTTPALGGEDESPSSTVELTLFWGEGCPHCAAERGFLDEFQATRRYLVVHEYEVLNDERNRRLFREMAAAAGIDARSVPTTLVGERVCVGFGDQIAAEIEAGSTPCTRTARSPRPFRPCALIPAVEASTYTGGGRPRHC